MATGTDDRLTVGVLALQGAYREHAGMLTECGARARLVKLPQHLAGLDGLVIPGGESTTIAKLMARYGLVDAVRLAARRGLAIWGTCAGLILLGGDAFGEGDAAGGGDAVDSEVRTLGIIDMEVERNYYGRQIDSFEQALDISVIGAPSFQAVFIRAPVIRRVGSTATVIAKTRAGEVVGVASGRHLATAFHPELTDDTRMHRYFLSLVSGGGAQNSQN